MSSQTQTSSETQTKTPKITDRKVPSPKQTTLEENKEIVRRMLDDAFNAQNLDLLKEVVSPEFLGRSLTVFPPADEHGIEDRRKTYEAFYTAMPDVHAETLEMIAEGDLVVVRDRFTGTHTGDFAGYPPTGNKVDYTVIHIYRIADGKIVDDWTLLDSLTLMQQMGAVAPLAPPPPPSGKS